MALTMLVLAALAIFTLLAFFRASVISWVLAVVVAVFAIASQSRITDNTLWIICGALLIFFALFAIPSMRRAVIRKFPASI